MMTLQQLTDLLLSHNVQIAAFGTGSAKTLAHLLKEVQSGEAVLEDDGNGRLMRRVTVLGINVFVEHAGARLRLTEDRQVFIDQRVRSRSLPTSIAEKLQPGEDVVLAVGRALDEELSIKHFTLLTRPQERTEVKESPSYPGISSTYTTYEVSVLIAPHEYKAEYQEVQPDKTSYFVWASDQK